MCPKQEPRRTGRRPTCSAQSTCCSRYSPMPRPSAQARRLCAAAASGRASSIARTCAPRPPPVRPPRRPARASHQPGAGPASTSSSAAGASLHLRHSAASAPQAHATSACPTARLLCGRALWQRQGRRAARAGPTAGLPSRAARPGREGLLGLGHARHAGLRLGVRARSGRRGLACGRAPAQRGQHHLPRAPRPRASRPAGMPT